MAKKAKKTVKKKKATARISVNYINANKLFTTPDLILCTSIWSTRGQDVLTLAQINRTCYRLLLPVVFRNIVVNYRTSPELDEMKPLKDLLAHYHDAAKLCQTLTVYRVYPYLAKINVMSQVQPRDYTAQNKDDLNDLSSSLNEIGLRGELKGFSYLLKPNNHFLEFSVPIWRALALSSTSMEDLELTITYGDHVGGA